MVFYKSVKRQEWLVFFAILLMIPSLFFQSLAGALVTSQAIVSNRPCTKFSKDHWWYKLISSHTSVNDITAISQLTQDIPQDITDTMR